MKNEQEQLEALQDIRKMMKDSSKFLSLSGLAGVFAGAYALAGALLGYMLISDYVASGSPRGYSPYASAYDEGAMLYSRLMAEIVFICAGVLGFSLATALLLSHRKAKKMNQRLFDHTSKKVFWCMAIPLFAGGMLCIALLLNNMAIMIAPAMLLFYGMALLHSSKYTIGEIRYLAYLEIGLGIVAAFAPGHGLLFWALGFGVLHIIYGIIMWSKYDRHN